MAQAASNGHAHGDDVLPLLVEAARRNSSRIEEAFAAVSVLRSDMEEGRREDVNRLADKLERGFERMAADGRERENRLNIRLDRMDEKLVDVCDKGRKDHDRFDSQYQEVKHGLLLLNHRFDEQDIRQEERRKIVDGFRATGQWVVEHAKDIAVVGGLAALGLKVFLWPAPAAPATPPTPVTVHQETLSHGPSADLRLDFSNDRND